MTDDNPTVWDIDEHTEGKHGILRHYLEAWFPILGQRPGNLLFVDGFAGPGRYTGGEPGSPVVALETLLKHSALPRLRSNIRFDFIEERADRVAVLQGELLRIAASLPANVRYEVSQGEFAPILQGLLDELESRKLQLAPAFVMIDPFGISGFPISLLSRILGNPQAELYITFMASWMNRFRNTEEFRPHLMAIYGDDSWKQAAELPTGEERVAGLLDLYEKKLRAAGATFIQRFDLYKGGAFVYSLFFATKHRLGCARMKDAIWKIDPSGGYEFRGRRSGRDQLALGLEFKPNYGELGRLLTEYLRSRGEPLVSELEDWLDGDETPFRRAHLRTVLKDLENRQVISVDRGDARAWSYPKTATVKLR